MIGIVGYGIAISRLDARLPKHSSAWHGVLIAVAGWLVMMVVLMPMAGAGMFGMAMSPVAPIMTLVLHLIFGAVLGWTYGRLVASTAQGAARPAIEGPDTAHMPIRRNHDSNAKGIFRASLLHGFKP